MNELRVCVPEHAKGKLEAVLRSGVTLVEAGAGYGKTTLVRCALADAENVWWHLSAVENPLGNFRQLCRILFEIDPEAGARLETFGFPNRLNAVECMAQLGHIRLQRETYLVMDNFQSFMPDLPRACLSALINHHCAGLHVVIISHYLGDMRRMLADPEKCAYISKKDMSWTEGDIERFFAENGLPIDRAEAARVHRETQGWGVAVSLCLRRAQADGTLPAAEMSDTLDLLVWRRLDANDRARLLAYGFFETLDESQLMQMERCERVPTQARMLLGGLPMVGYDEYWDRYSLHELLRDYLEKKRASASAEMRRRACERASRVFLHEGDRAGAILCYLSVEDWEGLLSLDLRGMYMARVGAASFEEVAERVARAAALPTLERHPLQALYLAYCLFGSCRFALYENLMARLREVVERADDPALRGEWLLISALSDFPDLEKMGAKYREALSLFPGPSRVIGAGEPYFFGCISIWALFYAVSGAMEKTCETYDRVMADYRRLTGGNGAGAEEIYRGEVLCVQGRFDEAEICAFKAAYAAEQAGELSIVCASALLRGIICVYRGDDAALREAVEYLEARMGASDSGYNDAARACMLETARGYILGLMLNTQNLPLQTADEENMALNLTFANFMLYQTRVTDMILRKEYRRAIACIETLLKVDSRLCSVATRTFMLVGLALCYLATARIGKAAEALDEALSLCAPDRNYTFVARMRTVFAPLFLLPRISGRHAAAIREIKALKMDYVAPDDDLVFRYIERREIFDARLTPREEEVARLAAQGLRNKEIAQRLYLSEATVKFHLKAVFQKLQIDRRSKIMELLK